MSQSSHHKGQNTLHIKSNKSSIVRVIISNFDDHSIKEIKVLYLKQGGVDTFLIDNDQMLVGFGDKDVTSGPIHFGEQVKAVKSVLFNDPTQRYQPPIVTIDNGDIFVTKTSGYGNNDTFKHYVISGKWRIIKDKGLNQINKTSEAKIEVIVTVTDLIPHKSYLSKEENQRRRAKSETHRILLSQEVMKNYSYILNDSSKVNAYSVDSINIHRANAFLEYRSQMLYYFTFINHFFMNLDKIAKPLVDEKIKAEPDSIKKDLVTQKYEMMLRQLNQLRTDCDGNLYCLATLDTSNVNLNNPSHHYQYKINESYNKHKVFINFRTYIPYIAQALYLLKNKWFENYQTYLKSEKNISSNKTDSFIDKIKSFTYGEDNIEADIEKILCELTAFRHALAHYDYQLFDSIYRNPFEMNTAKMPSIFKQLNDLKLFELLNILPVAKMAQRHPYIDSDDTIFIMGKMISLRDCAYLYDLMGSQKDGFKATINDFFCQEGVTNPNIQYLIKESIETEIDALKKIANDLRSETEFEKFKIKVKKSKQYTTGNKEEKRKLNTLLNNEKNEIDTIPTRLEILKKRIQQFDESTDKVFYYEDIHYNREYKDIYNKHKEKKQYLNDEFAKNNPNNEIIKKYNEKLHEYNTQMLALTKENAKIRLEARVRLAFGFMYSNYNWNVNSFKEKFNCANDKSNKLIRSEIKESYTLYTDDNKKRSPLKKYFEYSIMPLITKVNNNDSNFNIKHLAIKFNNVNANNMNLFTTNSENNLFKFYTLIALFLPKEYKGDFLGFAKRHYYDSKNIVDYHDLHLQGKGKEKGSEFEKHDTFFHHMRLFSKQIKSYDIFNYKFNQVIDHDTLKPLLDNAVNDMINRNHINHLAPKQAQMLDAFINGQNLPQQLIRPIMSFYQLLGHLSNQIEMRLLIQYSKKYNILSLHEAFNTLKKPDKPLLFKELLEKIYVDIYKDNNAYPQFTSEKKSFLKNNAPYIVNTRNTVMHMKLKELLRDNICDPVAYDHLHQGIFDMFKLYTLFDLQNIEMGTDVINQYLNAYDQLVSRLILKPDYRITKQKTQENEMENKNSNLNELLKNYYALSPYVTNEETLIEALKTGTPIPKTLEKFKVTYNIDEKGKKKKLEKSLSDLQQDENRYLLNSDTLDFKKISKKIKKICSNDIGQLRSLMQQNFSLYIAELLSQLKINRDIFTIKDYTDFNRDSNNPIKYYRHEVITCDNQKQISSTLPDDLINNINLKPQNHQTSSKTYIIHYPRDRK